MSRTLPPGSSDDDLDTRLAAIELPVPRGLRKRILDAADTEVVRTTASRPWRLLGVFATVAAVVVVLAIALRTDTDEASAQAIAERMVAAMDGKCMLARTNRGRGWTESCWFQWETGKDDGEGWSFRVAEDWPSTTRIRAWSDECLRLYDSESGVMVVAHDSPGFRWPMYHTIERCSRLAAHPDARLRRLGRNALDAHGCDVICWDSSAAYTGSSRRANAEPRQSSSDTGPSQRISLCDQRMNAKAG